MLAGASDGGASLCCSSCWRCLGGPGRFCSIIIMVGLSLCGGERLCDCGCSIGSRQWRRRTGRPMKVSSLKNEAHARSAETIFSNPNLIS